MDTSATIPPYAPVLIKLLQGILYYDDMDHWKVLLNHSVPIREYFATIGIEVRIDENEGYAYLHQPDPREDDDQAATLPRLVRRDKLGYRVTLLCVLLREELQQFDLRETASDRLVLSKDALRDMMRPFLPERTNETRLIKDIDTVIHQVVDLGFLKSLKSTDSDQYEVRRILKAKIDADKLGEIRQALLQYQEGSYERA
ncbi:MAG: DUF4194 domain-containing protein [Chloroflexaceae bacterium]|nr:DUF4194 domain-containing protein [Chloroflexaceae bacterium]